MENLQKYLPEPFESAYCVNTLSHNDSISSNDVPLQDLCAKDMHVHP